MDKCVCVCTAFELVSTNTTGRFERNRWNEKVLLLGKYTLMASDPEIKINKKNLYTIL